MSTPIKRTLGRTGKIVKKKKKAKTLALVNTAEKLRKDRTKEGHQIRSVVLNLHWTL